MAPDIPMPAKHAHLPDEHPRQHQYWRRLLEQQLSGVQFLWNYLAYVDEGGFGLSPRHLAPQRADETDVQYEKRRAVTLLLKETLAIVGTWDELAVEVTRHIRPSDAGGASLWILDQGFGWCRKSGFDPSPDFLRSGATPLLLAMCPVEHRFRSAEVLNVFWREIVDKRPPSIHETAAHYPVATLHTAAAMAGAMFADPACVPDRLATQGKLADFNTQLVERLYPAKP